MRELTWGPGSAGVVDYLLSEAGPPVSAEARLVYLKLFSHMDEHHLCWPHVGTQAKGTGLSGRTVQRKLRELEAAGLVLSEPRDGEPTVYRLYPPWAPRQGVTPYRQSPPTGRQRRRTVTHDTVSPQTESHPRQADTPDTATPAPRQPDTPPMTDSHPTHDTLTPEVTQRSNSPKEPNEDPAAGADAPAAPPEPGPDPPPLEALNEDLMAGWHQVLGRLEAQLPKANFDAWLRPAVPVELRGRKLVLAVDTQFAADRLTARYGHLIRQTLRDTTAGRITDFEVRVRGQPQP